MTFSSSTLPGVYTVKPELKPGTDTAGYNLNLISGTYTVTGKTYALTGSAMPMGGVTVGDVAFGSPTGNSDWTNRYVRLCR